MVVALLLDPFERLVRGEISGDPITAWRNSRRKVYTRDQRWKNLKIAARLDDREVLLQLPVFSITYLICLIILLFVFVICIMFIDLTNIDWTKC